MDHPQEGHVDESDRRLSAGALVLHVDDSPTFATLTATMLEGVSENLTVITETSAAAGLARLASDPVDCIVSDYQMPGTNGIEFLEAVREDYPDLPFVLFTGRGSEAVASRAISAGITDYLQKSSGLEVFDILARQIENAVERRRAVERFEAVLASAPDGIVIVDARGIIEEVNQQTEALFGHNREDVVGEPVEVLLPCRVRDEHVEHRERYVADPGTRPMGADLQLSALHENGTEFPVDIAISPVSVGGRLEVIAAVRDTSAREGREAQLRDREATLERQSAHLERAASVAGPELHGLLAAAREQLALARETDGADHLAAADRLLDQIERLFDDLSRLASEGRPTGDPEPVSLASVASHAWATVQAPGASLVLETDGDRLLADPDRIERLLVSLFLGATNRSGPNVNVRVESIDDGFVVEDDGPALPPGVRAQIRDGRDREGPVDFELATVQRIVASHGWTMALADGDDGGVRIEISGIGRPE